MSLMEEVIAEVEDMGRATVDDLIQAFPGVERAKLKNALNWASFKKRIKIVQAGARKGIGGGKGSFPSTYGPITERFSPEQTGWVRPVSFVFDLGQQ